MHAQVMKARRDAIMRGALEVIMDRGYSGVSMDQIAEHVGNSKATLYKYFASKEDLLEQALLDKARRQNIELAAILVGSDGLRVKLQRFVSALLKFMHAPKTVRLLRVAIAAGDASDVVRRFYEIGTRELWRKVADVLSVERDNGLLRPEDSYRMAMLLRCLCKADLVSALIGEPGGMLADPEADRRAQYVVDMFLRAYGVASALDRQQQSGAIA